MNAMRTIGFLTLVLLVCAAPRAEAADDSPRSDATFEELLKQGIALRRAGNDEAALAVFLDLEKMNPDSVRVLLHVSTAAQATGRWVMAYDYLQRAENHRDDPYFQRHKGAIETVEWTIAQRVGQFRALGSPTGAEVRLNGQLVGTLPMVGVRPVEIGSYVLEVTKPGYYPMRRPITIAAGSGLTQESVELREQSPVNSAGATAVPPATLLQGQGDVVPADAGVRSSPAWWRARWVTWTLAGVGVAAGVTSGVALGIRQRDASQWNDNHQCLDVGNPERTRNEVCGSVRDNIHTAENVAIGAGITGAVFLGAALVHGLATSRDRPSAATGFQKPVCTPGLGGFACSGTF
ncbi:MAG: PEGA domain-containing protein [Myxococcales bacterium]|nr:PEGA domain-containing protein [Myxococcales bacterium]